MAQEAKSRKSSKVVRNIEFINFLPYQLLSTKSFFKALDEKYQFYEKKT